MVRDTVYCMTDETKVRHLTPEDLAEREGVPVATIYQWNYRGGGPAFIKVGKHVRYRIEDVMAWEEASTRSRPRREA